MTDQQRIDQLLQLVRELQAHVVWREEYIGVMPHMRPPPMTEIELAQ